MRDLSGMVCWVWLARGANGQRRPMATCVMMLVPMKLKATVEIQLSGVALVQYTPSA
jgi:hypothetical protein